MLRQSYYPCKPRKQGGGLGAQLHAGVLREHGLRQTYCDTVQERYMANAV